MKFAYKIDVHMYPSYHDNPKEPYFWMIASIDTTNPDSEWCNSGAGWAETPEKAWEQALAYYNKYKKEK